MSHREECYHCIDFAQYMSGWSWESRDGDHKLSMLESWVFTSSKLIHQKFFRRRSEHFDPDERWTWANDGHKVPITISYLLARPSQALFLPATPHPMIKTGRYVLYDLCCGLTVLGSFNGRIGLEPMMATKYLGITIFLETPLPHLWLLLRSLVLFDPSALSQQLCITISLPMPHLAQQFSVAGI